MKLSNVAAPQNIRAADNAEALSLKGHIEQANSWEN
jgi:hypothetical protein